MASIFSRIIQGEIPAYKIAEDDNYFAFLDVFPLSDGHTLVIPKQEVDNIFDLSPDNYSGLFLFSQKIGIALKKAIPCNKVGISVVGLEVPHAHIHLIPINQVSDMNFSKEKKKATDEQLKSVQTKILSFLQ